MKLINAAVLDRNPGERSGEISVWMLFLGDVFSFQKFQSDPFGDRFGSFQIWVAFAC
jgi:hypothetical protein